METYWNGEPAAARRVRVRVAPAAKSTFWYACLEGTVRRAVEVTYGGGTFYLDDEDGSGWNKVTTGRGSPTWGHRSLSISEVVSEFKGVTSRFRDVVPQTQAFRHDPENGSWGDCHRTAIAVVLGLDRDKVPHFAEDGCGSEEFHRRVDDWLEAAGLMEIKTIFEGENDLDTVLTHLELFNRGVPFILGGTSGNGVGHSVVCQHGEIACDPSIDGSGIVGPMEDNFYWVSYLVKREPYGR